MSHATRSTPIEACSTARVPIETTLTRTLLDEAATRRLIAGLSNEIDQTVERDARLVLVGIRRRGDLIAEEIATALAPTRGEVPTGSLDITLYRDDFAQVGALPLVGTTTMADNVDGAHVIIVDDVLYTGRTIRAALNELSDFGRAHKIELCVLVDRGGRQLPIQPDYVGYRADVEVGQEISVRVPPLDGGWGVDLVEVGVSDPVEPAGAE